MGMALQTTFNEFPAVAYPGQLLAGQAEARPGKNADSVSIPFGTPVAFKPSGATSELDVTVPANSTDNLYGIVFRTDGYERAWTDDTGTHGDLDGTGLRVGVLMDVARKGEIWVTCQTGCAAGDRLFVAYSAGTTYTAAGQLGNVAESSHTIDATTKGQWLSTASAGGLARLAFDFLNK